MHSRSTIRARLALAALAIAFLLTSSAAFAQTKAQQTCVNTMNKSGTKLAATQGKENAKCVKDAGKGKLGAQTVDACITADNKGKVGKAQLKTIDGQAKKCSPPLPPFGFADASIVNAAAVGEEQALFHAIFGNPADPNVLTDKAGASCQSAVAKTFEKFGATRGKEFAKCKKDGFKFGTITSEAGLEACITSDSKSKVSKARGKILTSITKKCSGVTLATAFPGCGNEASSDQELADCLARNTECHMCLIINAMDGLEAPCDQIDDGTVNQTCRQCGNGATEAPEECDDGGESATCDADCTLAVCGDGTVNATAGEVCDDGAETANCDDDCTAPVCGDGNLNTAAGEVCDDGNLVDGDGCDSNCTPTGCGNGITTAGEQCDDGNASDNDACLTTCVLATCGDGFECSDSSCTSGPTGGTEECDDANASDNDACLTNCALATCGDGFLCSDSSCTSGPTGGTEECDDGVGNSDTTPDACRTTCALPSCGDSVVDTGEFCDEGGTTATCDGDCTAPACGDGFFNAPSGEQCDDGNASDNDACLTTCVLASCGDGFLCSDSSCTSGPSGGVEECDDGNTTGGDGCSSTCGCSAGSGELGCQDEGCPDRGELILLAGTGDPCATNGDCLAGTCDLVLGRCVTETDLDTGWTGIAHDSDINNEVRTKGRLVCEGPSPVCGECIVAGIDPEPRNCRCANDNRAICDEPFQADNDDCGGNTCNCYFGGPLPLSAGNTPACVVNRFAQDVSGTANVDLGNGEITANLRSVVYLGETITVPCPVCGGTCTAGAVGAVCLFDVDCDTFSGAGNGVCGNFDPTPNDGVRGGTCVLGANAGASCDIDSPNTTFPGPTGGGHSLDCFPSVGKNVSGAGLIINLTQTTGSLSLSSGVECGFPPFVPQICPCGVCSGDTSVPCSSNADCGGAGTCGLLSGGATQPNGCNNGDCTDLGGGDGECTTGPDDKSCDGVVRASGEGYVQCGTNADCANSSCGPVSCGACTITKRRKCFPDPITASGTADPETPVGVAIFCIPATGNSGINSTAGLPGPGRVVNQVVAKTFCASDPNTQYTPGVGGCP